MKFTKMHGLGNDYVYVNGFTQRVHDPAGMSRIVSDRHRGIGSDGLILIMPSRVAGVRMEMYNADGSRSEMCGNGIRCVAKYAVDHGLVREAAFDIETDAGVKHVVCVVVEGKVRSVRVDMGPPRLHPRELPCTIPGERVVDYPMTVGNETWKITCVSMGNPHAVIFVPDVEVVPLKMLGPRIERAPDFPQRINVHVAQVISEKKVRMRTWERGSGLTQACGTGACAVSVAAALTGRAGRRLTVTLPGGDLEIEWGGDEHVYKTGPAVEVFNGEWPD